MLEALENVADLETDHEHARLLAEGIDGVDGFDAQDPETNIVLADVSGTGLKPAAVVERLRERDVLAAQFGPTTVRFRTTAMWLARTLIGHSRGSAQRSIDGPVGGQRSPRIPSRNSRTVRRTRR